MANYGSYNILEQLATNLASFRVILGYLFLWVAKVTPHGVTLATKKMSYYKHQEGWVVMLIIQKYENNLEEVDFTKKSKIHKIRAK